jgi:hypothetical protein
MRPVPRLHPPRQRVRPTLAREELFQIPEETTHLPLLCRFLELQAALKEVYEVHQLFYNAQTGDKDFPPVWDALAFKDRLYARTIKVDMLHTEVTRVLPLLL